MQLLCNQSLADQWEGTVWRQQEDLAQTSWRWWCSRHAVHWWTRNTFSFWVSLWLYFFRSHRLTVNLTQSSHIHEHSHRPAAALSAAPLSLLICCTVAMWPSVHKLPVEHTCEDMWGHVLGCTGHAHKWTSYLVWMYCVFSDCHELHAGAARSSEFERFPSPVSPLRIKCTFTINGRLNRPSSQLTLFSYSCHGEALLPPAMGRHRCLLLRGGTAASCHREALLPPATGRHCCLYTQLCLHLLF